MVLLKNHNGNVDYKVVDQVNEINNLEDSFENKEIPEKELPENAEIDQFFEHYFYNNLVIR